MKLVGGSLFYKDGHVELENLRATHGSTQILTGGTCDVASDGSWQLRLRDFSVSRLRLQGIDHELESALPPAIQRACPS